MSRIDDNSDNQRIAEMQEQELRLRKDQDKKREVEKVSKSFGEVMREKSQQQGAQRASLKQQGKETSQNKEAEKNFAQTLLKKGGTIAKQGAELQRRAAMSQAMHAGLNKTRSHDSQKLREAEAERSEDLIRRADDDKDRVDRELRADDERQTKRTEEKEMAFHKIDPDGERKGSQDPQGGRDPKRRDDNGTNQRAEATEATSASRADPQPRVIPAEVIEKLVSAIHQATHADGRTELQIELKGTMLSGVTLKVRAEHGKVHCTFEGADRDLKNLLESSKGALMRGLSKRGLKLESLRVV